jgi:hypothetical protein
MEITLEMLKQRQAELFSALANKMQEIEQIRGAHREVTEMIVHLSQSVKSDVA